MFHLLLAKFVQAVGKHSKLSAVWNKITALAVEVVNY
jgi:hypothetical protein